MNARSDLRHRIPLCLCAELLALSMAACGGDGTTVIGNDVGDKTPSDGGSATANDGADLNVDGADLSADGGSAAAEGGGGLRDGGGGVLDGGAARDGGSGVLDGGRAPDGGRDAMPSSCSPDSGASEGQWIWQTTAPKAAGYAVWAAGPDDVWLGGGDLFHWNGTTWSEFASGTNNGIFTIWGTASNDVWAGCIGSSSPGTFLVHWNGSAWTPVPLPASVGGVSDIWGTGPNDVWAVDGGNGVLHFDGTAWTLSFTSDTIVEFSSVWGTGARDVWAAGFSGAEVMTTPDGGIVQTGQNDPSILHYDGTSWSQVENADQGQVVHSIWSGAPNDAWAVGEQEPLNAPRIINLQHWNGTTWSLVTDPVVMAGGLGTVWGIASDDVWAGADLHWNGSQWKSYPSGSYGPVVGGYDDDHLWAVSDFNEVVLRFYPCATAAMECQLAGGTCTDASACGVGQGDLSAYSCASASQVCCLNVTACDAEPQSCISPGVMSNVRPQCELGQWVFGPGTENCMQVLPPNP